MTLSERISAAREREEDRVRDPLTESIYRSIREDDSVPVTDAGRFIVTYWPHRYQRAWSASTACAWCAFPRLHAIHPDER